MLGSVLAGCTDSSRQRTQWLATMDRSCYSMGGRPYIHYSGSLLEVECWHSISGQSRKIFVTHPPPKTRITAVPINQYY